MENTNRSLVRSKTVWLAIMVMLAKSATGQEFANHWYPVNQGAQSIAMGRSTVMDQGITSLFNNPSALGLFKEAAAAIVVSRNTLTQENGHLSALSGGGESMTEPQIAPYNIAMIYPSNDVAYKNMDLSYGFGYSRCYQWVSEHSWSFQKNGSDTLRQLSRTPGIDVLHAGAGASIWDDLLLGMTINIIPGREFFYKDVIYSNDVYVKGLAEMYTSNLAYFFTVGVQYVAPYGIELGLTFDSAYELLTDDYWTSDNTISRSHSIFKAPPVLGIGFGYTYDSFHIIFEHIQSSYSEMEIDSIPLSLENAAGNHLGIEYTRGNSKIRAGYYTDYLPVRGTDGETATSISGLTVGYGHTLGNLSLNAALDSYSWSSAAFIHPLFSGDVNSDDKVSGMSLSLEINYVFEKGIPFF